MKKYSVLIPLLLILFGCGVNKHFVNGVDGYAKVILPEYENYIIMDSRLADESKYIRLETVESFRKLIEEAIEDVGTD